MPCRQTYGQPPGSQRRAARMSSHDAPQSASSAIATPPEKAAPLRQLPTCSLASTTTLIASDAAAASRQRLEPATALGLDVAAERRERRHPPDGEQRDQCEDERDPKPHPEPERHGSRRHRQPDVDRQQSGQEFRQEPLRQHPHRRTERAAGETHRRGFRGIDGEHSAGARTEAAEHGDGVESAAG